MACQAKSFTPIYSTAPWLNFRIMEQRTQKANSTGLPCSFTELSHIEGGTWIDADLVVISYAGCLTFWIYKSTPSR
jgi:hypothetical protein